MATKKKTRSSTATRSRSTTAKRETAPRKKANRQVQAVLLFAAAVLLLCMALIPGESAWLWLHGVLLGLLSYSAYLLPVVLAFVAVMLAMEKDTGSVSARIWESAAFVLMFNSLITVWTNDCATVKYFPAFADAFTAGQQHRGGGALGNLLGWPVECLLGDTGAKIVVILLMIVFFMLVTGTTILTLLRAAKRPVEKTKESIEQAISYSEQRREERREERREARSRIDVDLGEGYPRTGGKETARDRRRRKAEEAEAAESVEAADSFVTVGAGLRSNPAAPTSEKLEALENAARAMREDIPATESDAPAVTRDEVTEAENEIGQEIAAQSATAGAAYRYPPLSLLDETTAAGAVAADNELRARGQLLVNTLRDFGIETRLADITIGPAVTRYELEPSAGVKISRITGLADDIALRLATTGVRIEAPIPNKAAVGIEVPNKARRTVGLRSLLDTADFRNAKGKLTVALGQDIEGDAVLTDLAKMPHLLIAGTTGSGKSVCTNSMIQSVLFRANPDEVKMILIDPKKVEFGVYNGIPHLLVPVVTDPRKAAGALSWAVNEMLKRYQMFAESNVRDIAGYNEMARGSDTVKPLPLILIVIDELADLMMAAANEVEDSICRLAQMARAAGMHMVIATQRPSVDVITGLIKANIPSRLALTVASAVDSRTILDAGGAEKLLGYGDMLFMPVGQSKPRRVQGCFVTNDEIERVIAFLQDADKPQEYDQTVIEEIERQAAATGRAAAGKSGAAEDGGADDDVDEALNDAIELAVEAGQISTSMLQRKMRFGYARAGRIIDQLEQRGIVGPSEGSKPRKVLISRQQWLEMNMNQPDGE